MEKKQKIFTGERAEFGANGISYEECTFLDGESHLKESSNIKLQGCLFQWKYPLWYCKQVEVNDTKWFEGARAGVWYTSDLKVSNSLIAAPKNFRRCQRLNLDHVTFTKADETLWSCQEVTMADCSAKGDYFAMNCSNMEIQGLQLDGNYSFDGAKNVHICNSTLLSKDAFWNSENVTVEDSFISGEYLGWNSKNLTLINCTVESLQGMCYIENLTMKNCRLLNTTLAFEYSSLDAEIDSKIQSLFNPKEGQIKAEEIGLLIMEKDQVNPDKTKIICQKIDQKKDKPDWKENGDEV